MGVCVLSCMSREKKEGVGWVRKGLGDEGQAKRGREKLDQVSNFATTFTKRPLKFY